MARIPGEKPMTDQRLTVISSDCHAGPQRMADFRDHLDPVHRDDFDEYCAAIDAFEAERGSGLLGGGAPSAAGEDGLWDADTRTSCLDDDGVAAEVIFAQGSIPFGPYPAVGGFRKLAFTASAEQVAAGCRAYNRWLAQLCAKNPLRHLGIARVPLPDVDAAVAEVEFAARLGLRGGIQLPPITSHHDMPFFNDPAYERFWASCAANRMVLNMHGGANLDYGSGPEGFALTLAEVDWLSHRGLSHLIFSGVFERYPDLHLAMTEQRANWVHQLLDDFDSVYEHADRFGLKQHLPKTPREYFFENCFIGASFLSQPECEARDEVGNRCFMWASDYPHNEGTWPYTNEALRYTFGWGVPFADLEAMLSTNAARCYRIDLDELRVIAGKIGPTVTDIQVPIDTLPGETEEGRPFRSWAFRRHGAWH
jgi:predicted TIM-barrel fold metal-dependent hydrolase